jgi:predicted anti-sigma-YlaC factor YlaD
VQVGLLVLVAIVLFAWSKGGPGERVGAAAVAVAWIGSLAVESLMPADTRPLVLLGFDVALSTALLAAALLYPSFWLGATMMLQAFVLAVHAFHLEDGVREEGLRRAYIAVLNAVSYSVLLALAASTLVGWLKRRRAIRVAAPANTPLDARPV